MPIVDNALDSGQELRWREWQEKGRRNDRMAAKRMKVVFIVVGLILLAWILYHALQPRMSADSDYVRRAWGMTTIQTALLCDPLTSSGTGRYKVESSAPSPQYNVN